MMHDTACTVLYPVLVQDITNISVASSVTDERKLRYISWK